jgi:hypothetical protein
VLVLSELSVLHGSCGWEGSYEQEAAAVGEDEETELRTGGWTRSGEAARLRLEAL